MFLSTYFNGPNRAQQMNGPNKARALGPNESPRAYLYIANKYIQLYRAYQISERREGTKKHKWHLLRTLPTMKGYIWASAVGY